MPGPSNSSARSTTTPSGRGWAFARALVLLSGLVLGWASPATAQTVTDDLRCVWVRREPGASGRSVAHRDWLRHVQRSNRERNLDPFLVETHVKPFDELMSQPVLHLIPVDANSNKKIDT